MLTDISDEVKSQRLFTQFTNRHMMKASVVVCTYSMDRYEVFYRCVESVLSQRYEPLEVVLIVDGNDAVFERVQADFGDDDRTILHNNARNRGISYSRTKGAELASGDVVVFIDDDATAAPDWVAEHVAVYEQTDAIAAAGPVEPDWVGDKPTFFPPEFYWLVGCTERGFADDGDEIRNGYGSNVSYRQEAFLAVGGYDPNTGRKGEAHIQAHEPPVGVRLQNTFGQGVYYTDSAVVYHTLFRYRGDFQWLIGRSFWQGYSKRIMDLVLPEAKRNERAYLKRLLFRYIPERVSKILLDRSFVAAEQLVAIIVFTLTVGLGYTYALTKSKEALLRDAE